MSNKLLLILLSGLLVCPAFAQKTRYRPRTRRPTTAQQQTPQKEQKKEQKKENASSVQNPAGPARKPAAPTGKKSGKSELLTFQKPALTLNYVNYVLKTKIKDQLLERKIPAKLPKRRAGEEEDPEDGENPEDGEKKDGGRKKEKVTFISRLDFAILMSEYSSLIDNFELTEVSLIRLEWYQKLQAELRKFGPIINEMTIGLRTQSHERYAVGMAKFKAHQKACLDFMKEKPPKISKEQYEALVLKNTRIRRQNYQAQLQREREAAAQRRQEQLKQQQEQKQQEQQNQQQNQPKPAAPAAGK